MSGREGISEEKAKKIAVGATVAGVLVIIFLLVILIIQFVMIGTRHAKEKQLEKDIAEYEQMIEEGKDTLDWYLEGPGLYMKARSRGWGV